MIVILQCNASMRLQRHFADKSFPTVPKIVCYFPSLPDDVISVWSVIQRAEAAALVSHVGLYLRVLPIINSDQWIVADGRAQWGLNSQLCYWWCRVPPTELSGTCMLCWLGCSCVCAHVYSCVCRLGGCGPTAQIIEHPVAHPRWIMCQNQPPPPMFLLYF